MHGVRLALLLVVPVMIVPPHDAPGAGPHAGLDGLSWLAGCWQNVAGGVVSEEWWTRPAGGTMLGVGRTVKGEQTLWYEFLQIRLEGDSILYVAGPSGQEGAAFLLTSLNATTFVFENPGHDFPARIIYRRIGTDSLHAQIEGVQSGKPRTEHFPFRRVSCD